MIWPKYFDLTSFFANQFNISLLDKNTAKSRPLTKRGCPFCNIMVCIRKVTECHACFIGHKFEMTYLSSR